jgi:hypothetical protein
MRTDVINPICSRNNLLCFRFRLKHFRLSEAISWHTSKLSGQGVKLWNFTPSSPTMFYNVQLILRGNFVLKLIRIYINIRACNCLICSCVSFPWISMCYPRYSNKENPQEVSATTGAPVEIQTRYLRNASSHVNIIGAVYRHTGTGTFCIKIQSKGYAGDQPGLGHKSLLKTATCGGACYHLHLFTKSSPPASQACHSAEQLWNKQAKKNNTVIYF